MLYFQIVDQIVKTMFESSPKQLTREHKHAFLQDLDSQKTNKCYKSLGQRQKTEYNTGEEPLHPRMELAPSST